MIARMLCAGGTFNKGELRERVDQDLGRIPHPTYKDMLESSADWAKHFGCGNCGEQSALAFVYLRDLGIRPLDWIQVNNFKHAFVVVGRVSGSDPEDYTTWGRSAYYCDPWLGDSGEAAVLHVRYWRKKIGFALPAGLIPRPPLTQGYRRSPDGTREAPGLICDMGPEAILSRSIRPV